ncbi:MAG: methyl-accepting chemotaxis protein [Desulfobacterales bacterium]|nr:methyl-accepting chemotaxis protein [Desulfobacterales bacterium]
MAISEMFWKMAEEFVALIHNETGNSVIVCDENGVITCSTDKSRIGITHAGAQKIMSGEVDEVFVTAQEALDNPKVKEGYNCVVKKDENRFGTFGIAGPLKEVKPLARISSVVMTSWLNELAQKEQIEKTSEKVFSGVDQMMTKNKSVSAESASLFKNIEGAAKQAVENLNVTDEILKTIQDISSRSNILSINGTIEASRAGEKGRAFAVVAGEMRQMSKGTKEAASTIEANLDDINASMLTLSQTLKSFSQISEEQHEMMDQTVEMVASLKTALDELKRL